MKGIDIESPLDAIIVISGGVFDCDSVDCGSGALRPNLSKTIYG